jgi:LysR family transcriptional regulator for metE and metH
VSLEVRHLRALDAIAREGTVTAAAARVHLTQSAVSHMIRGLEDQLGVPLFRRDRSMEPTDAGERVLRCARIVLDEIDRTEHEIGRMRDGYRGVLRLTTQCYTCYHWLPSILERFGTEFPEMDLHIVPEATRDPDVALRDGGLDLAVVHERTVTPGVTATKLFRDELVAIVSPEHPWASREYVDAKDFAAETVVLHSDAEDSALYRWVLDPAGVRPRRVLELQLTEALLELVKSGRAVSVMASWAVAPAVRAGSVTPVRITRKGLFREWFAAVPERLRGSRPVDALVRLLKRDALSTAEKCSSIE